MFTPTIKVIDSIPPDSNPFLYDSVSTGLTIVSGFDLLYQTIQRDPTSDWPIDNLVLVNTRTGQRVMVTLNPPSPSVGSCPVCGTGVIIARERKPNGLVTCENGHQTPAKIWYAKKG